MATIGASLLPADRQEYDRTVASLQRTAYRFDLDPAWTVGHSISLEQAVTYALRDA